MRKKFPGESVSFYRNVEGIKSLAESGVSSLCSMGSQKKMPFSFDDLHFVPAQVSRIPLNEDEPVNLGVILGPKAKKPLKVSSPIMFSAMSYGAVSRNVRLILTQVANILDLAINSGEDIVIPEVELASKNMILQYSTVRVGISDDILKRSSAVEIRFGQGAYPGWRSLLPAAKVPLETILLRGLKAGEDEHDLSHHPDIRNAKELADKIGWLKGLTGGVPVGAKIGCGNVEADVEALAEAGADFIALDGFGAGTGATEFFVRENVGIPVAAALPRAHRHLQKIGKRSQVTLIAGGGLRTAADFAKCLSLGANAVYIATSALIAINCQQYRICHTGNCPTGVATNNPALTQLLNVEEGVRRLINFIEASNGEIAGLARIVGKDDVGKLGVEDLVTLKQDAARATGVKWLNGEAL
jgi:glutamate synthase domain-containing protein 2